MKKSFAGETATVKMIPIGMIHVLPQVRTTFKESSIAEMAADIKAHGVLQPLVVQPADNGFNLRIGERRFRAIKKLGAEFVPAIVANVANQDWEEIQLVENIQREDLNTKDLCGSIHKLWKKHKSVAAVAKVCHKSKSWVSKRLAIALDVGPLTVQLLDANVKDVELLYGFGMLEKADHQRALGLLPDILEKQKGRKDVQAELQIALGKKAEQAPEEPEDTTGDLFAPSPAPAAAEAAGQGQEIERLKAQLLAAQEALAILAKGAKRRFDGKCWIVPNKTMGAVLASIEANR